MTDVTDTLTPHDAARVIAEASRYEDALQQRTEGLTAMLWGLVSAAIFLTYAYVGELARTLDVPGWTFATLWAPWVLAGNLFTLALWRSAALSQPVRQEDVSASGWALRALAVSLLIALAITLWQPRTWTGPLVLIGASWAALALLNPYRASPRGRLQLGLSGAILVAAGVALAATGATDRVGALVAIAVSGGVPLLLGLHQTLRG